MVQSLCLQHEISHCVLLFSLFNVNWCFFAIQLMDLQIQFSPDCTWGEQPKQANDKVLQYLSTIYPTKPRRMTKGYHFQSCWHLSPPCTKSLRVPHHPLGIKGHISQPKQNQPCNEMTQRNVYLYGHKTFIYSTTRLPWHLYSVEGCSQMYLHTKPACRNGCSPQEGTFQKPKAENSYSRADATPAREKRLGGWGREVHREQPAQKIL